MMKLILEKTTLKMMTTSKTNSESRKEFISLLITAAGSSTRMGSPVKKEYLPLETGTVLSTVLKSFLKAISLDLAVITIPQNHEEQAKEALACDRELQAILNKTNLKVIFVTGSGTRQQSVFCGLKKIKEFSVSSPHFVLIHDGARPYISQSLIERTLNKARISGAAFPGLEPTETQKRLNQDGIVTEHLKRTDLISVQTPQIFDFERIFEAHLKAESDPYVFTDDTEIWGKYTGPVSAVKGDPKNIKITYAADYKAPKAIDLQNKQKDTKMIRTGLGYDLHRLVVGRKLYLGGVEIPFEKGEDGHSDGDVLLHAITDALLGACGMGDIGSFFPPEEAQWKDADSKMLLKTVWDKITAQGWKLENLDCVIHLEKPKFLPHRQNVINSIASVLDVNPEQIFVKAKTYEKTGNWENQIEAQAVCLLSK